MQLPQGAKDVQLHGGEAVRAFTFCDKPGEGTIEITSAVSPLPGSVEASVEEKPNPRSGPHAKWAYSSPKS